MSDDGNDFDLPPNAEKFVDIDTFEQILEMDDDDGREFSRQLVFGFFDQAQTTFDDMERAIDDKDLEKLSSLGHFLKGSSATLGLYKVRDTCEKIQHWGARKDQYGNESIDGKEALDKIEKILPKMKKDYDDVKKWLVDFFGPDLDGED